MQPTHGREFDSGAPRERLEGARQVGAAIADVRPEADEDRFSPVVQRKDSPSTVDRPVTTFQT